MTRSTSSTAKRPPASLIEALEDSLARAAAFAPGETAPPAAVLWTDEERAWERLIPLCLQRLPQLLVHGPYDSSRRAGPAIWLKCVLAGTLEAPRLPGETTPIIYLPGLSRQTLRAAADCPRLLQPLVELCYRGTSWTQRSGKDWTLEAFLVSEEGLRLDVARDTRTREALKDALHLVATTPLKLLAGRRLEADDFIRLHVEDPVRDVLSWIDDSSRARADWSEERWRAFRARCRESYRFDPNSVAPVGVAETLAVREDAAWQEVWRRFAELPDVYPGVAAVLRRVRPGRMVFVEDAFPHVNEEKEAALRRGLMNLAHSSPEAARQTLLGLEAEHGKRRGWPWARIGQSPLAQALEPLVALARHTGTPLGGDSPEEMARLYADSGYRADEGVLAALARVSSTEDSRAVRQAARTLYLPWVEDAAERFQSLLRSATPGSQRPQDRSEPVPGECTLFVDGLRFDLARRLVAILEERRLRVALNRGWAALPTVTATGKPAVSPVSDHLRGPEGTIDFTPVIESNGQALTIDRFRRLLRDGGIQVIADEETGDPLQQGARGWAEAGAIDTRGHTLQEDLPGWLPGELERLADRIQGLLGAGWTRVRVVTDHGWLLIPGGLPKWDLPSYLVATRWARCAVVKGSSQPSVSRIPWHWNRIVELASAPGVSSFMAGLSYAHGGVSLQECVTAELLVEAAEPSRTAGARIREVQWLGLRCRVTVEPAGARARVDIRLEGEDPRTIVGRGRELDAQGRASLVVEDDENEGKPAAVLLLDPDGLVVFRVPTTVGRSSREEP